MCIDYGILVRNIPSGCAEYVVIQAQNLLTLLEVLTFDEAAAFPLVFQTAWRAG